MEIIETDDNSEIDEIDNFTILMSIIVMIVVSLIVSLISIIFTQNILNIVAVFLLSLIVQYIIGWVTHSIITSKNDKFYSKKFTALAQESFDRGMELGQTVELSCPCAKANRDIIVIGHDEVKKYNCSECQKDIIASTSVTTSLETSVYNKEKELEILKQIQNEEFRSSDYRSTTE
jgi:energy-coupling factor transporter transmembrane protein EcfT